MTKYKNDENTELVGGIKETLNVCEHGMVVSKEYGEDNWYLNKLENESTDDESKSNSNFSTFKDNDNSDDSTSKDDDSEKKTE